MGLFEILGSVITGGASGLAGTAITAWVEHKKQAQKNAHELALLKHEKELATLEIQGRERVATVEAEGAALVASYEADARRYGTGTSRWAHLLDLVDVVRGLTRPVLSGYFAGLLCFIWYSTNEDELRVKITATILYVATTGIVWWFGSRAKQPK